MLICSLILWCLEQIWLVCWRSLTNIRKSIKFKIIKHNNSPKSSDTHTLLVHFNTFLNRTMNVDNGIDQLWVYDKALKYVGSKNILSLQSPINLRGSLKKFALRRMKSSVHKIVYRQMNAWVNRQTKEWILWKAEAKFHLSAGHDLWIFGQDK